MSVAAQTAHEAPARPYVWRLPPGFPVPPVPADNPMTEEKVELGRRLFYDRRLSGNGTQSCASCHAQALAYTDGRARATGSTGELHERSAPSLANVAYAPVLTWTDARVRKLEAQALIPLLGTEPVEMGVAGREAEVRQRLEDDPALQDLFRRSFPEPQPVSFGNVARALAAFQRTLISGRSPFDAFVFDGQADALTPPARRGLALFQSSRLGCTTCHHGLTMAGHAAASASGGLDLRRLFRNTGVGPARERFRIPTLRNVAVTAPYMHDGSLPTLEAVIDHYAGSRGGGRQGRDPLLRSFALSARERDDLIEFLRSLTDATFLADARSADPAALTLP